MNLKAALLDLLFPPKCPFCGALLDSAAEELCSVCQRELPWLTGREAEQTFEFVDLCVSPLRYQERVRKAVHRYKFQGRRCYAAVFGGLMAQCAGDHFDAPFDAVSWVPLSAKRRRDRGYDQAELLAREVGRRIGAPVLPLLRKVRDNPAQSGLNGPAERRANVLGVYALAGKTGLDGKRVLLCDDVATTGPRCTSAPGCCAWRGRSRSALLLSPERVRRNCQNLINRNHFAIEKPTRNRYNKVDCSNR